MSGSAPPAERSSLLEIELGEQPAATPAAPDGGAKPPRKRTDAASVTLRRTARALAREAARADWLWPGLAVAGVACFVVFVAGGGLALSSMTTVEIVLTLGAGAIAAALLLVGPLRARERPPGSLATALLVAFTVLTVLSIVWSVAPDASYRDTGRMLAYTAVFGVAVMLARALPARVTAVIGGATLAAVIVCGYALLTKVFPGQLDASDIYARLRAPYSYWNATGLTAAMGAVGCLWLGARRDGHALLRAAAYPAMGLLLATLLLAYSRGALAALEKDKASSPDVRLARLLAILPAIPSVFGTVRGATVLEGLSVRDNAGEPLASLTRVEFATGASGFDGH